MKMAKEDIAHKQVRIRDEKFNKAAKEHFNNLPVKEFMNRSKKLQDSIRLDKSWNPFDTTDNYKNTFDYEKFNGNEMRTVDFKYDPEDTGEFAAGQSI